MSRVVAGIDDEHQPLLPPGRSVWLPGRGDTFVRELDGPAGAPSVVLLHGWTATAGLNWLPCFAPLARHFRVIALDHRGHGRGMRTTTPFTLEDCADDVAALARELDIDRFIAVGYSMGGPIAQLLWQRHRGLVDGLVMCATGCTFRGRSRERVLFSMVTGASAIASTVPLRPLTQSALGALAGWQRLRGRRWWGLDEVSHHDWPQIIAAGRELGRFDSQSWVHEIDVPTTVIVTDTDDIVPAQRQRALAAAIPDASVIVADGGHDYCTLAAGPFAAQLLVACKRVASRGARSLIAA